MLLENCLFLPEKTRSLGVSVALLPPAGPVFAAADEVTADVFVFLQDDESPLSVFPFSAGGLFLL